MKVEIKKLTNVDLLQRANAFTTGHESKMTLAKAYAYGHSPIRTQLFWVECTEIPLFVASQLVRSHVGVQFFQRSKRTDRGGEDFMNECYDIGKFISTYNDIFDIDKQEDLRRKFENKVRSLPARFDRYAPTDLAFIINAEALINMAHKRLCGKASAETRQLMQEITSAVAEVDTDLAEHLVPQCVYRGGICSEPKCCGLINSDTGNSVLYNYFSNIKIRRKKAKQQPSVQ